MRFESRDPFQEKLRREDIFHTDWDRYAHMEYNRLAQEEEEAYDGSMEIDVQAQSLDADGRMGGGDMENWSLQDEEEESEDEDDALMGNHLVNRSSSGGGNGGSQQQWGHRR